MKMESKEGMKPKCYNRVTREGITIKVHMSKVDQNGF